MTRLVEIDNESFDDEEFHKVWWHVQDILKQGLLDQFPRRKALLVGYLREAADLIEKDEFHN